MKRVSKVVIIRLKLFQKDLEILKIIKLLFFLFGKIRYDTTPNFDPTKK